MTSATHTIQSSECGCLYVALELSAREWLLTMSPTPMARPQRARVRPGDREALLRVLQATRERFGLAPAAPVRSCYEAGREGFWPHRLLAALGVTNRVVDSSSIEVSRRARQTKTDRLDGAKLLRMLQRDWGGEHAVWRTVHVPTGAAEDARHASRTLTALTRDRTRYRNGIHGLLALHGVGRLRLDAQFPGRLTATMDWAGAPIPAGVQARLLVLWRLLTVVETERRAARQRERQAVRASAPASLAQRLAQLRGVAARSATILADELLQRRLRNRREVGALAGLVSAPYASGGTRRDQGLARSGLPAVRRLAVELAWAWLRYQPTSALTRWYHARFGGGGAATRRIGIVALARRVVIALWRYGESGRVPDGAVLKA